MRQIVRAKAGRPDELQYVKLLQRHQKLRDGLRTLGSWELRESVHLLNTNQSAQWTNDSSPPIHPWDQR